MVSRRTASAGRIFVIGSTNMDLFVEAVRFPRPGETFEGQRFYTGGGGKGANQAMAAGRLAGPGRVEMVGRVGSDGFGEQLLANFKRSGVGHGGVEVGADEASGVALIFIDGNRENYVVPVYGANAGCGPNQVDAALPLLSGAAVLITQQEVNTDVSAAIAREARARGVTVILDPAPVRAEAGALRAAADIVTPNQLEAEAITGVEVTDVASAAKAASAMRASGVPIAIVTLGEQGCFVDSDALTALFPAPLVTPVATVAAGDAFAGALATALSEGCDLASSITFATKAGSLSVTKDGAQESMPWRAELDAWSPQWR
jgi:ribokinase